MGEDLEEEQFSSQKLTFPHSRYEKKKEKQKITSVGENVKELEPLGTDGENVKWSSHYGKQYSGSSKN